MDLFLDCVFDGCVCDSGLGWENCVWEGVFVVVVGWLAW